MSWTMSRKTTERQWFRRDTWCKCALCSGKGVIQPMLKTNPESVCVGCNGVGWIPPDGEPLTEVEALMLLRKALDRQTGRVRMLRRAAGGGAAGVAVTPADYVYRPGQYRGD
jgi:hypothetical protein